ALGGVQVVFLGVFQCATQTETPSQLSQPLTTLHTYR
ncbi:MAG: hypothetical protein QOK02_3273, partial [Mycobacterium sp.]|nr:hypothetical protein [Mycobacterium sp.]